MIRYQFNKLKQFVQYDIKYANISCLAFAIEHFNMNFNGFSYDEIEIIVNHIRDINEIIEGHTILWYVLNGKKPNQDIIELLKESGAHE